MSEEQKSAGEKKNGSPGAGKSLAVMQQRLLSKSSTEEAKEGTPAATPGGNAAAPQPAAAAPGAPAAAAAQNRPKSKGKDFAVMAMNAKTTAAPSPVAAPPAPEPVAPNRPKGKDFAAMANRMPAPAPPPVDTGPVHPQDPARAAKMQAAARAAAGLPPLAQPTATSVTVAPPPIQASVPAPRPAQQIPQANVPQASYRHPPQAAPPQKGPTPMAIDPRHQAMPRTTQETQRAPGRATSGGQSQARRNSGSKQQQAMAAAAAAVAPVAPSPTPKAKPAPKRTPQPSAIESRLSFNAGKTTAPVGGPHTAPLVGQRLRDLVSSLDPSYALDAEAEEQVLLLADDFLDKVTRQSIRLAQHRGSRTLDVQDVQLALSKQWGIEIPGLGPPTLMRPTKPANRASASGGTKRRASSSEGSGAAKKAKTTKSNSTTTKAL